MDVLKEEYIQKELIHLKADISEVNTDIEKVKEFLSEYYGESMSFIRRNQFRANSTNPMGNLISMVEGMANNELLDFIEGIQKSIKRKEKKDKA